MNAAAPKPSLPRTCSSLVAQASPSSSIKPASAPWSDASRKSNDDLEQLRLRQRLEAQETQGETIDGALYRLQSRVTELSSFAEAGLTMQDFRDFGLHDVVDEEAVEAARLRREARASEMREDTREDGREERRDNARAAEQDAARDSEA
ncbi:MAG: hypothetical protein QM784_22675 [Polyangiaceae bacterium]